MAPILLILFIVVPLIEIGLFIEIGGAIGLWPTLGIVFLTAVAGTAMVRAQGVAVLAQARREADAGQPPMKPLMHGLMIVIAGALLLTPGFFTDACGLALLLPPVREWLGHAAWRFLQRHGSVHVHTEGPGGPGGQGGPGDGGGRRRTGGGVIEGEYRDVTGGDSDGDTGDSDGTPGEEGRPAKTRRDRSSPWRK